MSVLSKLDFRTTYLLLGLFIIFAFSFCQKPPNKGKSDKTTLSNNGIVLPDEWPPKYSVPNEPTDMPVPYLENIPEIIPINIGRQLLVDDFLIEEKTNLKRTFHYPQYYGGNPVLEPDKPWEYTATGYPYAAPFSDGVWYDERDNKFKMWYSTGGGELNNQIGRFNAVTAYAISEDGINWEKPQLDVVKGTNLVDTRIRDSNTIWLDKEEKDTSKRYKLFNVENGFRDGRWRFVLKYSSDGINWSEGVAQSGDIYDRSTVFYNPFREKWVFSTRLSTDLGRSRSYLEHSDPETGVSLVHRAFGTGIDKNNVFWFGPWQDELKHPNPDFNDVNPAIYNHDAIAYESLLLGFFTVWQGPENEIAGSLGIQKRNEVAIGYSRDGFHWHRPDMSRFHSVNETEEAWNFGNVQSVVGSPLIIGDSLYFYMSGRRLNDFFWDSYSSTGLASLRRDGFASMDADTDEGTLLTRELIFDEGKYLFVNVDASKGGQLLAEVLDKNGSVIEGFSKDECQPIKDNSTKIALKWRGERSLESLEGTPIKIRFYLTNASLYSFWISKYQTGESEGYTAGGGPDLHPSGRDLPLNGNNQ